MKLRSHLRSGRGMDVEHRRGWIAGDDRGNTMIIAMAVLMIMGILAASVWAKTISGMHLSQKDTTHFQTMAVANSGVDEAMFRIEQLDPQDDNAPTMLSNTLSLPNGSVSYRATRQSSSSWQIVALGVSPDGSQRRAIRVDAVTMPKISVAIGSKRSTEFNGNVKDEGLCSFSSSAGIGASYDTLCAGDNPYSTGQLESALLGTSGDMNCGNAPGWDDVPTIGWPTYDPNTNQLVNPTVSCGDNSKYTVSPAPYDWSPFPVPADAKACPDNGIITSSTIANNKLAPKGHYTCANLTLGAAAGGDNLCLDPATFSQSNDVEFYITGDLTYSKGVTINTGQAQMQGSTMKTNPDGSPINNNTHCPGVARGPAVETTANDWWFPTNQAGAFRVFGSGTGQIHTDSGNSLAHISQVLYAPDMTYEDQHGATHVVIFGSLMVSQYHSGGEMRCVAFDNDLTRITTQHYVVANWREIVPPASV